MKKNFLSIVLLIFSAKILANEEVLMTYAYSFPLLICYSEEYRACYNDISVEACALDLKQYRESCLLKVDDPSSTDAIVNLAACMVVSHSGAKSFEEISDPCIKVKGMNINITKNVKKIKDADQKWVQKILK